MSRWEYHVIDVSGLPIVPHPDLVELLNELGTHGWELVTGIEMTLILKRELSLSSWERRRRSESGSQS